MSFLSSITTEPKSNPLPISRQRRPFLLLELLVALFLASTVALPLADLPMMSINQQLKNLYLCHAQRLADLTFALSVESCYQHPLSWEALEKSAKEPHLLFEDTYLLPVDPSHAKPFIRRAFLKHVSTKVQGTTQWALVKIRIELEPAKSKEFPLFKRPKKSYDRAIFAYYVILQRENQTL